MADVQVQGLTKRYGEAKAVDALDLHVQEGDFVTLLGPSGCGKTTTLRCIAGLEVPEEGTVSIGGQIATAPAQGVFTRPDKRDIGMVFQSYALWPHLTVFGNVAYPLKIRRTARAEVTQRVHEMLELVGLAHLASRPASALSGGQQQRVAVARALVSRPRLLLFDEPLSNLDARLRASMRTELRAIHARTGTTSICVTHDQIEALTLSDRVVVMEGGRIQQQGTPEEIFSSPVNRFVAKFVGYENSLPGTVIDRSDTIIAVRLSGDAGVVRCRPGEDLREGAAVEISVRSGAVRLEPVGSGSSAEGLRATVVDRAFLGESVQFVLEVGGIRMLCDVPTAMASGPGLGLLRTGDAVQVDLPYDASIAFAAEGTTAAPAVVGASGLAVEELNGASRHGPTATVRS